MEKKQSKYECRWCNYPIYSKQKCNIICSWYWNTTFGPKNELPCKFENKCHRLHVEKLEDVIGHRVGYSHLTNEFTDTMDEFDIIGIACDIFPNENDIYLSVDVRLYRPVKTKFYKKVWDTTVHAIKLDDCKLSFNIPEVVANVWIIE
ncbi:hypothetical protein LCGC14_1785870 [marine sediment metagenome]|uniref:Uncharacterized protein n=1 Tax=marine sediment metagenome TaxID=412755 RepID=A0A0F9GU23_9ZZZZ